MDEARKKCSTCLEVKDLADFQRNKNLRFGVASACKVCAAKRAAAYYAKNRQTVMQKVAQWRAKNINEVLAKQRVWNSKNKEAQRAYNAAWRKANPERARALTAAWQKANPERMRELRRSWSEKNKPLYRAFASARKALLKHRLPAWSDKRAIRAFYVDAERLTRETGVRHAVDHIIPLKGRKVSGLHVETNLRVITHHENSVKNNRYEVAA